MFYSTAINSSEVAENIRSIDVIKQCAELLRGECKDYKFDLDETFNLADDCHISYENFTKTRPRSWIKFFDILFPYRNQSHPLQRKCDTIFQIFHYVIHQGKTHNPFHVSIAELLHDDSRAKLVINILNKLGLCISYDELQRIDNGIMNRIINIAGQNRVPVSLPIGEDDDNESEIQGAMDNFDHDEATFSGIGGSHDTILMLFQNSNTPVNQEKSFSKKTSVTTQHQKSLNAILPCQELTKMGKFSGRGKIPATFSVGTQIDLSGKKRELEMQHMLWILARYLENSSSDDDHNVPSFAAVKSLLDTSSCSATRCAFTPILPHPATEYDTIFTTMINFQDVLRQRGREAGALWSDEGVYHIAKEIQLLQPEKFSNIFLGLGGFHLEKVVIGCLGTYLECSGIHHLLVEEKIFGPGVVNSVMSGGNYVRGKRGMALIAEAMQQLQIMSFLECSDGEAYGEFFKKISLLKTSITENPKENQVKFDNLWRECLTEMEKFQEDFQKFQHRGSTESNLFAYWNNFITNLAPVLRDLTQSFRQADWHLHLSSVDRSIDLCFSFDRINYKRWLPIYYEDCVSLPLRFPKMNSSFMKGDFVVRHTTRRGSAVPMDQALEKAYNKPAKSSAGIIGFTRRKEAVCKWNIIKHEKGKYRNFLYDVCQLDDDDEYSLHHEFSHRVTKKDNENVAALVKNISQRGNPFDLGQPKGIMNIATGAVLEKEDEQFYLNCQQLGKAARSQFYKTRLEEKTMQLLDNIPKTKKTKKKTKTVITYDLNKETVKFLRQIDFARLRGFDMKVLLSYEISPTSFYLTKDGLMRKTGKSDLVTELRGMIHEKPPVVLPTTIQKRAVIIDFMAYVRKVPIRTLKLTTYNDLFGNLWDTFMSLAYTCERIDIVFDVYIDHSVKASERRRRATMDGIETLIQKTDQTLPVEMERFWSLSQNKTALQQHFISWTIKKVEAENFEKQLFLGGSHRENSNICLSYVNGSFGTERLLECSHEEADDRIFFHIHHAVRVGYCRSVLIASADTDIFTCATHHFAYLESIDLEELWMVIGRGTSRVFFPIHKLSGTLDTELTRVLIVIHALSGADCLSKVGSKARALKEGADNCDLLSGFGQESLTEEMITKAEKFLLKCISSHDVKSFDELRFVVFHEKHLVFDIERFPPTTDSIRQHIIRAYFQCFKWFNSLSFDDVVIDPLDYGYYLDEDEMVPILSTKPSLPKDFPHPCTCKKCAKGTVCKCRVLNIACCQNCKCQANSDCRNPVK